MHTKMIRRLNFVVFNQLNFWGKLNHEKKRPHISLISGKKTTYGFDVDYLFTCTYQTVRNASFLENFAYLLNERSL